MAKVTKKSLSISETINELSDKSRFSAYSNPLITRYASKEMSTIFSEQKRIGYFRRLWVALAEGEQACGLNITNAQIKELNEHLDDINFDVALEREKEVRHDVMAHIYAYGKQCPQAAPIIHLGATSCYVTDNADIIIYKEALELTQYKLVAVIARLREFALKFKKTPTLGFTHYQPAQPVTVGKRATLWIQELLIDYNNLVYSLDNLMLRGVKGATGTQAGFMTLFDSDSKKIHDLEDYVKNYFGFTKVFPVTGQTYTRKADYSILTILSGIAQSAYKFSIDLRLLQSMKEVEEPFEKNQVGSSAMAYKRNPMRSERISSIARYLMSLPINAAMTAATQGFERTLDDSANRRIVMGQAFLAVDAILELMMNVTDGLVVYEKVIERRLREELPFIATEAILMECVKAGGSRQHLHEKIREHSMACEKQYRDGGEKDLIARLKKDSDFDAIEDYDKILDPKNFIGRSDEQTIEFINQHIDPILDKFKDKIQGLTGKIEV
ncbi:MAG: adenylosuccinate lyase [Christensenellaceae bacterium]|jgi:adenylosuccinate lyase|nr:adenylosuccinate lyase [Christensenellaceae bacterium]